jgi:hypothetical protein
MPAPASATNFAGCSAAYAGPCYANNSNHYFSYGLDPEWRAAQEATRTGSYETTDLNTFLSAHAGSNGVAISDVHVGKDPGLPSGIAGLYTCQEYEGNFRCYHAHISYSPAFDEFLGDSADFKRHIACHETGHSLGLRHSDNLNGGNEDSGLTPEGNATRYVCMSDEDDLFPSGLGSHNVAHINGKY